MSKVFDDLSIHNDSKESKKKDETTGLGITNQKLSGKVSRQTSKASLPVLEENANENMVGSSSKGPYNLLMAQPMSIHNLAQANQSLEKNNYTAQASKEESRFVSKLGSKATSKESSVRYISDLNSKAKENQEAEAESESAKNHPSEANPELPLETHRKEADGVRLSNLDNHPVDSLKQPLHPTFGRGLLHSSKDAQLGLSGTTSQTRPKTC